MLRVIIFLPIFFLFFNFSSASAQSKIQQKELKEHVSFLASEKNKGRYPGTKESGKVVKYICRNFHRAGIENFGGSYLQPFEARLWIKKGAAAPPVVKTCNVIGVIPGSDPVLKHEYLVLGAHYDHLGMGGPSSKDPDTTAVHFGADDNASGIAALLEIGEELAANRHLLKRSIILAAFGAEEQGLLGSKFFTAYPPVPLSKIKLMINMDMVGRLNTEKQVYVNGAGTFKGGVKLMERLGPELDLSPLVHAGGVSGSDHVFFYRKNISAMGVHTGAHPQYHTTEDRAELINIEGMKAVCEFIYKAVIEVSNGSSPIEFIRQD